MSWTKDSLDETLLEDRPTGLQLDAFNAELFRKNVEIVISKLEAYLADFSIVKAVRKQLDKAIYNYSVRKTT